MTKKISLIFTFLLISLPSVLGAENDLREENSLQKYILNVSDFTDLQVVESVNVIYRNSTDSAGLAVFNATKEVVPALMFSNNKNKLKIQINEDMGIPESRIPTVTVYSNFLISVENSGDSTVVVETVAPGAVFKANIIGNGTIVVNNIHATQTEGNLNTGKGYLLLSGVTKSAKLKNIGTGRIDASGLQAETGSVTILGTGPILCDVKETLNVKGMGTGKIYLTGSPVIKKTTLGSINVVKIEETEKVDGSNF